MRKLNSPRFALTISLCLILLAFAALVPSKAAARREGASQAAALAARSNGKIAFSTTRDGNSEVYVMNADGSGQTRLTNDPAFDGDPAWSPDGARLLFVSTRDGNEELYVMNADGSSQTRLTNNNTLDRTPVWSPDGAQIAFASNRDSVLFDIFIMNANGSSPVNISRGLGAADYQEPDWSPDGTRIACSQALVQNNVRGPSGVLVMNTSGNNQTRLTLAGNTDVNPRWSPDGAKLVFSSDRLNNFGPLEIFLMNPDGSNQQRLTNNTGENSRPFWSPDGARILFQSNKGLSFDLYVMNADGSNQASLFLNTTDEFQPVWQGVSTTAGNPIDDPSLFVRRHYLDFLYREPDSGGLAYWTSQITMCGADTACVTRKRAEVSAAFFFEQEFQQTGYFIYRHYAASFCRRPTFAEFTTDRSTLTTGANLEATKQALTQAFVQRAEFIQKYPLVLSAPEFVDALLANVQTCDGLNLTAERANLIVAYNQSPDQTTARARVLRLVMDNADYIQAEFNKAFVQSAYFGYLRRNEDPGGYQFWLDVLNTRVPGNYRAMVCAFITSTEYQRRFGTVITRSNNDCAAVN
jgi:Tol biopolymer transport system component